MGATGYRYWLQKGFIGAEASAYQDITEEAIKDHRYLQVMIDTRMRRFREYYQEHENQRYVLGNYYKSIRNMYVSKGWASNGKDLVLSGSKEQRDRARTITFQPFNAYKDKYAIRDNSGRVVQTPRKKTKVNRRKITGNSTIDQVIKQSQADIKQSKFRLSYAKTPEEKASWEKQIKLHQNKIKELKTKKN
jgi:hypothetical protein